LKDKNYYENKLKELDLRQKVLDAKAELGKLHQNTKKVRR